MEVARTAAPMRTGVDDDLPSYSSSVGIINDREAEALQSMEVDEEDEGIADTGAQYRPGWTFALVPSTSAPPGSDQEDEAIHDDDSTKAVSPTSDSEGNTGEEEGTTGEAYRSYRSGNTGAGYPASN